MHSGSGSRSWPLLPVHLDTARRAMRWLRSTTCSTLVTRQGYSSITQSPPADPSGQCCRPPSPIWPMECRFRALLGNIMAGPVSWLYVWLHRLPLLCQIDLHPVPTPSTSALAEVDEGAQGNQRGRCRLRPRGRRHQVPPPGSSWRAGRILEAALGGEGVGLTVPHTVKWVAGRSWWCCIWSSRTKARAKQIAKEIAIDLEVSAFCASDRWLAYLPQQLARSGLLTQIRSRGIVKL